MRLFLLPISTRQTLIYCERVQQQLAPGQKPPISERILSKASETWAQWERAEKGWQKRLTIEGNRLLRRIPYAEWGLKSIPPATKKRLEDVDNGKIKFECLYPGSFMSRGKVPEILKALATDRQGLHRKRMWNSLLWMPITIPFAAIPMYGLPSTNLRSFELTSSIEYRTFHSFTFAFAPIRTIERCMGASSSST